MDKLKMHSVNKVDENVKNIGELFPNTLTEVIKGYNEDGTPIIERAIDFDMLKQELSNVVVEGNEERYQFTWPDKKKSVLLANAPIAKTLRPCKEESVDFDTTENLYIEGDNLDVLKLLQETYLNKVKMIYIDPPYNTGNDFVYEDDYAQDTDEYLANSGQIDESGNRLMQSTESNGRFHTDWLNMMYPRLKLAKDLLSDDGVIFISIDDNEVKNLRSVCEEVFGEVNFVAQLTLLCNPRGRSQDKYFATNHEYILVFSKLPLPKGALSIEKSDDQIFSEYTESDERGRYRLIELRNTHRDFGKHNRPNLFYQFYVNPNNGQISLETQSDFVAVEPIWNDGFEGCWTWGRERASKYIDDLVAREIGGAWKIYRKNYAKNATMMLKTILNDNLFYTDKGQAIFSNLFETKEKLFQSPKSMDLIKTLINTASIANTNDIILDFFSGSATTAHAVMQLNAEDGGNRKYIMVQLDEETDEKSEAYKAGYKDICEIGKERIRRAGKKIKEENKDKEGIENLDIGFRVLKVDSTNMKDVYYNPQDYTPELFEDLIDNIKEDRTPEDLLFQVMLDLGILLSSKITESIIDDKKVFDVDDGYLIACFDNNVTDETIKAIAQQKPYYFVMRDSSMASDSVATNFDQIFETYSPETIRKVL